MKKYRVIPAYKNKKGFWSSKTHGEHIYTASNIDSLRKKLIDEYRSQVVRIRVLHYGTMKDIGVLSIDKSMYTWITTDYMKDYGQLDTYYALHNNGTLWKKVFTQPR